MLNIENLGIEFSSRWLIREANYQFQPGECIGLIGRNGCGKSTLLKVLAGEIRPSEGQVNKSGKLKIAFFNQDLLSFQTDQAIFDLAKQAFAPLLELQDEIEHLLTRMEEGDTDEKVWDEMAHKQDLFEAKGGNRMDAAVHEMLSGLGFSAEEHEQPYHTFSGGWRMRVLLAKMLLAEPDVLLLDEPTNHLDLPSIQWLENYLRSYKGCTVIVSHDRYFLDRMVNKVVEVSLQQLNVYSGNYSFYLQEKAIRKDLAQKAYENQKKYIDDQERFINRFKAKASKARQAQSKLKQLDKIERLEAPEEESFNLQIRFNFGQKSGKEVARLHHIEKAYGHKVIIKNSDATIMRGDKIALIGANGLGKSTLLRIVAGTEPHKGKCEMGHNVIPTFFAQHQLEVLDAKRDILQEVAYDAQGYTEQNLRSILGSFMFSGDEVEKKISVLSGGERSRVALAKALLSEANFLLLDEPTNHLDIPSISVLVQALQNYEGTFLVVSHDRYFLQQVANKIWYIEDRHIKEYPGSYQEYELWREKKANEANPKADTRSSKSGNGYSKPKNEASNSQDPSANSAEVYKQQKAQRNLIKKLSQEVSQLEKEIAQQEKKKASLIAQMSHPEVAADYDRLSQIQTEHDELQEHIDELVTDWEARLALLEEEEGKD